MGALRRRTGVLAAVCALTLTPSVPATVTAATPADTGSSTSTGTSTGTGRIKAPSVIRLTEGANGDSDNPTISANGRYVAFSSHASNLVPDDTNENADIFVRDLRTGRTERVSTDAEGNQLPQGGIGAPAISATGRYVVHEVPSLDPYEQRPGFVRKDRVTGAVDPVAGIDDVKGGFRTLAPKAVSADGRQVAVSIRGRGPRPSEAVAVRDMETGVLSVLNSRLLISTPTLTADGRFLAHMDRDRYSGPIVSMARMWDRGKDRMIRLDTARDGTPADHRTLDVALSSGGRYAALVSRATNLVPGQDANGDEQNVFVKNLRTGALQRIDAVGSPETGFTHLGGISGDGRYVLFISYGEGADDWYVWDRTSGESVLAYPDTAGGPPSYSSPGRVSPLDSYGNLVSTYREESADPAAPLQRQHIHLRRLG
ncbi:PD40 domain-containing protein [Streptomyces clavuligerus]|uniref:WD40-like Beta Propeller n=1 Tax=Streptomyces clavuligerus TaxID=1901 RepID=B5GW20_STRCL|nr:PD40 domain-containing protein [Streptomyces clavuligerus]EDY50516.1 conserved hypothetical protein [Streptomyces clavuligerus]EFG03581.1 WD40-like Beta Propeller [Streptomyces clavuligerus]MBY6307841.1 PD40 domain-containing protein [Streptomyces clavuligerus]QCS09606.1 hypothetical protein CRV15_28570 [Streptomyces clavuligerus]QPJ98345.1 hypothetical protein GE265_35755 [Streptomyces clavuligerus]